MSLLLSDEAIEKIHEEYQQKLYDWQDAYMNGEVGGNWVATVIEFEKAEREAIAQAAVKHCLEQLEKEGLLRHDAKIVAEQTGRGFVNLTICREDCRACAKLREVEA